MKLEDLPNKYRIEAARQLSLQRRAPVPAANMERPACRQPVAPKNNPIVDSSCRIRVLCRRHRFADPDGISVKAVLDGLVLAGILGGDSAKEIIESPVITQVKIAQTEPEITILEIFSA